MKTKNLTILFFLILFCFKVNAQEFKLGKVSIAELEQKGHPKDSAAVAAILFKKGKVTFDYSQNDGFVMYTEVITRIKIYKKEGYDWANKGVRYRLATDNKERVIFSDAITYNLIGGKIEKTKLKSEGEFDEVVNKYIGLKKITMPNVKEGSVIEYKYIIRSPNIGSMRDWDFQTVIPVDYSEFTTYIPEYYMYKPFMKGFITPKITVENSMQSFTIDSKVRSEQSGIGKSTQTTFSKDQIDYKETKTTYITKDMSAIKEEAFVNNIDNYTVSLMQELSMIKYPNEPIKPYSSDWDAVVKTIYEYDDFGPELNKTGYFENDLKAVISGLTTQDEIIYAILNYVKSTVKWNEEFGYGCDSGVKKAYKEKTGNVADINLMLTAMLRTAGLKANPVLISTRANGISVFPNRTAFNYVIAAVETPEGFILLDATSKFSTPNVLPFRDLNWLGRLIRKDGSSEEVDLMPKVASSDQVTMMYAVDATGKISGKLRRHRTDHNAISFRSEIESIKEEEYLEKLENKHGKIEIADYSRTNEKDIKLPIMETCSFTGMNLCDVIGEKIYINPLLFFTELHNPFTQEKREYPIDFGFPFLDKYSVNIDIPEGFVVETLPKSAQILMEDNIGEFKFIVNATEKKIQVSVTHQMNASIVPSEYYEALKDYYQGMITKETEKIVLKKV